MALDTWSAGTKPEAFTNAKAEERAKFVQNVFGIPIVGLTTATGAECTITIKLPDGAVCKGEVAGLNNVCFARFRNSGQAGPFGGSGFFTQSSESRKRAIKYRLMKRMDN